MEKSENISEKKAQNVLSLFYNPTSFKAIVYVPYTSMRYFSFFNKSSHVFHIFINVVVGFMFLDFSYKQKWFMFWFSNNRKTFQTNNITAYSPLPILAPCKKVLVSIKKIPAQSEKYQHSAKTKKNFLYFIQKLKVYGKIKYYIDINQKNPK